MHRGRRPSLTTLLAGICALALVVAACADDNGDDATEDRPDEDAVEFSEVAERTDVRPVVFLHGGSGSGAQFQTQALRFASNGYPAEYLRVIDYDSTDVEGSQVPERLDALIAELQEETGQDQIDLMGHSLGTAVAIDYLTSDPARAANVAHYVNIDGRPADELPGGVPTLALWGDPDFGTSRTPDSEIVGGENVRFPEQSHVEIATSRESFAEMFAFFNDGEEPETLDVVPQPSEELEIAGRAVHFPQNEGVPEGTLEIYEVDPDDGERLTDEPEATFTLEGDAEWGPFDGDYGASYELVIVRGPEDRLHHFYLEPLIRSDYLLRLNTSPPEGGLAALVEQSDDATAFVFSRYKEWWGDQGADSDTLEIDGENILNEATSPKSINAIGVFAFDENTDGESNLDEPIEVLFGITFLTGVDVVVPAADPPDRTITVRAVQRGDTDRPQVVNVPNWASSRHAVSIHFHDFLQ